jgi:hypothetical protein
LLMAPEFSRPCPSQELTLNQRVQGSSPCAPTIELQSLLVDKRRRKRRAAFDPMV